MYASHLWKWLKRPWIRNVRSSARFLLLIVIAVITLDQKTFSQSNSGMNNLAGVNQRRLIDTIEAESKRGVLLSYAQ